MDNIYDTEGGRARYCRVKVCACDDDSPITEKDCFENQNHFRHGRMLDKYPIGVMLGSIQIGKLIKLEHDRQLSCLWATFETDESYLKFRDDELECGADWIRNDDHSFLSLSMLTVRPRK